MGENTSLTQSMDTMYEESEIDLLDLFYYYLTKIKVILLVTVIFATIACSYTKFVMKPTYTSYTKLYMVSASTGSVVDLSDLNIGTSLSEDYEVLLDVRPIYESTIDELNLPYTYEELQKLVTVSVVGDSRVIQISVTTYDKEEAKDIANTLANVAIEYLPEVMESSAPHVAEKAVLAKHKTGPSTIKNTLIGAVIGFVLTLCFYTIGYLLDDTLQTSNDIEKEFGVLPLATIPEVHVEGMTLTRSERDELTFKDKVKVALRHVFKH